MGMGVGMALRSGIDIDTGIAWGVEVELSRSYGREYPLGGKGGVLDHHCARGSGVSLVLRIVVRAGAL